VPVAATGAGAAGVSAVTTGTGIATAIASAVVSVVTACAVAVASAAVVSSESGLADTDSLVFVPSAPDSPDFDLVARVCAGLLSAWTLTSSAAAAPRSAASLFAGLSGAEFSRARPFLAAAVSSCRRGAGRLFTGGGEDSLARPLLSAAAVLLSTSEAKLSPACASDFCARWLPAKDRDDAISDVTLTTGRLLRWTGLSISKDRAMPGP
jgi:hypothetical protein